MEVYIIAVIFLKSQFSETIVLDAIRKAEAQFPAPHPNPEETYILTDVTPTVSVVFYEVKGYPKAARCFQAGVELFREDQFPSIIKACAKEQRTSFCFYAYLFDSTDDFMITCRYDERGFDERQSIDGSITHNYGNDGEGVQMVDYDAADKEAVRMEIVENYLNEQTGVTQQMLVNAWMSRHSSGTVIAAWKEGVKVR